MKKIFIPLVAIAGLLTSCSNDEIEIVSAPTTLNISTSKVMDFEGMEELANSGILFDTDQMMDEMTLDTDYRLRIRNMVYNSKGILVDDQSTFARTYINNVKNELMLPAGDYTVVTITDVVKVDGDNNITFTYWNVSDSTRLEKTTITDAGWIGGSRTVISATVTKITVDGTGKTYNVVPQPLGSLIYFFYANIHGNENVYHVGLYTKKSNGYISMSANGPECNFDVSNDYDYRYNCIDVEDYPSYTNLYGYGFVFAGSHTPIEFKYYYTSGSNKYYDSTAQEDYTFNAGEFTVAYCDVSTLLDNEPFAFIMPAKDLVDELSSASSKSRVRTMPLKFGTSANSLKVTDINKIIK